MDLNIDSMLDDIEKNRQKTIIVDGIEHNIFTGYNIWICFLNTYILYKNIKTIKIDINIFDFIYGYKRNSCVKDVPRNRENGLKELIKFFEEPFGVSLLSDGFQDTLSDYECLYDEFLKAFELYGIDIKTQNIHFHKFVKISLNIYENQFDKLVVKK